MASAKMARPTEFELDVLSVLWARGNGTVREVHEGLAKRREAGYTSVLKVMQIMHGKGLVSRKDEAKAHVYSAALSEAETRTRMVEELAARLFGGSTAALAAFAVGEKKGKKDKKKKKKDRKHGRE